jgi:hypothetical protein
MLVPPAQDCVGHLVFYDVISVRPVFACSGV